LISLDEVQQDRWLVKNKEEVLETFEDSQNVLYKIHDEFKVRIKKREVEFEPNSIQLFRVSLTPNESKLQQYMIQMKT
jgi:hypothetical protein